MRGRDTPLLELRVDRDRWDGVIDCAYMHGEAMEGKCVYDTHGRKHVHPVRVADVFLAYIVQ